jgi:hypothetical protein
MNIACAIRYGLLAALMVNPVFTPLYGAGTQAIKTNRFTHYHDEEGFVKKVIEYIKEMKTNAHLLEQNPAIQDLLDEQDLKQTAQKDELQLQSLEDLKTLLQKVSNTIEQVHMDNAQLTEQIRTSLLLRAAVPLYCYTGQVLFDVLKRIDKQIISWEHRAKHPVWYFFHKSPHKWFSIASQGQEIRHQLLQLRRMQKKYFQILGELTAHVGKFDLRVSYDKHHEWLSEFLSIILHMYDEDMNKQQLSASKLALVMTETARRLPKQYQSMLKTLAALQVPGHFEKNWWRYALLGAGATAAGIWLYKNYQRVPGMMQSAKQNIWNRLVYTPYREVKDAFLGDDIQNNQERIAWEQKLDQNLKLINRVLGDREPNTKQLYDLFVTVMNECSKKNYLPQNIDQSAINRAADAMINPALGNAYLALDLLEHAMNKSMNEIGTLRNASIWQIPSAATRGINETGLYLPLVYLTAQAYKLQFKTLISPTKEICQGFARLGNKLINEVERSKTQSKAIFAMLLCVPTAAVIYGAVKGTNKLVATIKGHPEYRPIRTALVDIAHILNLCNAHDAEMEAADYGKLIYLVHKLRTEIHQVPTELRRRFLDDIRKLKSITLTAEKKMKVIDLMYKNYAFLAPNYQ